MSKPRATITLTYEDFESFIQFMLNDFGDLFAPTKAANDAVGEHLDTYWTEEDQETISKNMEARMRWLFMADDSDPIPPLFEGVNIKGS